MTKIKDNCVLITGGASGIGRIMGRMSLEKGARQLVIWDINEQNIATTEAEFSKLGKVKGYRVDVSDAEAVEAAYAQTRKECGEVDILINCAGIVTGNKTFEQQSVSDIERTMNINAKAPYSIVYACFKAAFLEALALMEFDLCLMALLLSEQYTMQETMNITAMDTAITTLSA